MPNETTSPTGREWLIVESSMKHGVFVPDDAKVPRGYIPRDAAEQILGRDLGGNVWFTQADCDAMRVHPEWSATEPHSDSSVMQRIIPQQLPKCEATVPWKWHHPERRPCARYAGWIIDSKRLCRVHAERRAAEIGVQLSHE